MSPTIIRMRKIGYLIGMVMDIGATEDIYFQVYETYPVTGKTLLVYTMPWGSQLKAIEDFEAWENCQLKGLAKPYQFSYAAPTN